MPALASDVVGSGSGSLGALPYSVSPDSNAPVWVYFLVLGLSIGVTAGTSARRNKAAMSKMSSADSAVLLFQSADLGTDWMFFVYNVRGDAFQDLFAGNTEAVVLACLVVLILSTLCLLFRVVSVDCTGMPNSISSDEDEENENPYWKADKWQDQRSRKKKQFAVLTLLVEDVPMLVFQSLYLYAVGFRGNDAALIVISPMITIINLVYMLAHVSRLLLKIEVINNHRFKQHTQLYPSKCTHCREIIWFYSHACKRCRLMVHRKCREQVVQDCHAFREQPTLPASEKTGGKNKQLARNRGTRASTKLGGFGFSMPHTFVPTTVCCPAFCEQCGQIAYGRSMQCRHCNVVVHRDCEKTMNNNGCGVDNKAMGSVLAGMGTTAHAQRGIAAGASYVNYE